MFTFFSAPIRVILRDSPNPYCNLEVVRQLAIYVSLYNLALFLFFCVCVKHMFTHFDGLKHIAKRSPRFYVCANQGIPDYEIHTGTATQQLCDGLSTAIELWLRYRPFPEKHGVCIPYIS